ncbi:ROK family protein [Duganella sp. FT135W]|uniref:ROK family protein n=1 Tax=Duganella flavida TaxID=2692175 RepID=A0A6L8KFY3_9BURK|nr:hydantoinase/oxoprolinase family protein [Duganella flavida]MYM25597.1 ROK family protein [Duganella flavida]
MTYRIGVDVGGTHTDAALLDPQLNCLATAKVRTTPDVMRGIEQAIATVLDSPLSVPREQIGLAMLGTTHCTNALVERQHLQRVGLLRLAAPATLAIPPQAGWPQDLVAAVPLKYAIVCGGYEYDGRVLAELDEQEIRAALRSWRGEIDAVAVCGVFSPISGKQEAQAAQWVRDELGSGIAVTLSSEIGSVGLLERENAAILNAALGVVARRAIGGFRDALSQAGLGHARSYLGQNDGTLMSLELAESYPIMTLGCGPTNSLRGAAFLSGLKDALVVDVGGTTSDIGALIDGFPRESASAVEIGGARLNLRMPDILAIGVGGGTIVRAMGDAVTLGPDSVGYKLNEMAQIFGGDTLTLTDVATAVEAMPALAPHPVRSPLAFCQQAYAVMVERIEEGIDRMKVGSAGVPVVLVGGGSLLLPDALQGTSEVIRPPHFGAANAIGVAIAEISGEIDQIVQVPQGERDTTLAALRSRVLAQAVEAGAQPNAVRIIAEEVTPLAYLPGNACRVRLKAAGPLVC